VRTFRPGDLVLLVDHRGRETLVELEESRPVITTAVGPVSIAELLGQEPGVAVTTGSGRRVLAVRPTLAELVVHMPRGAQLIYPKDAVVMLEALDVAPGLRVLECGVGSGGLTLWLLRAGAEVVAVDRREEFARLAAKNVDRFGDAGRLAVRVGELAEVVGDERFDRVALDMVDPWEVIRWIAAVMEPGARLAAYVTNALQIHQTAMALEHAGFARIQVREVLERRWVARGQVVRPELRMVAHTGFVVSAAVTPRARERAQAQPRAVVGAQGRSEDDVEASVDGYDPDANPGEASNPQQIRPGNEPKPGA